MVVGNFAPGSITVSGGIFNAGNPLYVGKFANGSIEQTGGTVNGFALILGYSSGHTGTYHLVNGTLNGGGSIGYGGPGVFVQDGGTYNVPQISLGLTPGSVGAYTLNAGDCLLSSLLMGFGGGSGSIIQNGGKFGTVAASPNAIISNGSYQLNDGTAILWNVNVNHGTITQTGGTLGISAVPLNLNLGQFNSASTYNLSGGTAVMNNIEVGYFSGGGASALNQSGGTLTAFNETIENGASVTLSGGSQTVSGITSMRGTFTFTGGTFAGSLFAMSGAKLVFGFDPRHPLTPMTANTTSIAGLLGIDLVDGTQQFLSSSDAFVLFDSVGNISGSFSNVANGSRIATDGGTFRVNYGSGSPFGADKLVISDYQATPEPAGIALIGTVVGAMLMRRRRIQKSH
jgi:hypothetical protein